MSNLKRRKEAGATLVEMVIVLALLAIVSTMILSFTMLISHNTNTIQSRTRESEDVELLRDYLDGWMNQFDEEGYIFSTKDNSSTLVVTRGEEEYTFGISDNFFIGTLPNGQEMKVQNNFDSVVFYVEKRNVLDPFLVKLTASYKILGKSKKVEMYRTTRAAKILEVA